MSNFKRVRNEQTLSLDLIGYIACTPPMIRNIKYSILIVCSNYL